MRKSFRSTRLQEPEPIRRPSRQTAVEYEPMPRQSNHKRRNRAKKSGLVHFEDDGSATYDDDEPMPRQSLNNDVRKLKEGWPTGIDPTPHFQNVYDTQLNTSHSVCNSNDMNAFSILKVNSRLLTDCLHCGQPVDFGECSVSKDLKGGHIVTFMHTECVAKALKFEREVAASRLIVSPDVLRYIREDLGRKDIEWKLENHSIKIDLLCKYPNVECLEVEAIGNCTENDTSYVLTLPSAFAKQLPLAHYPIQVHNGFFKHMTVWQIRTSIPEYAQEIQNIITTAQNAFTGIKISAVSHQVGDDTTLVNLVILFEALDVLPSFVGWTNSFVGEGSTFQNKAEFANIIAESEQVIPTEPTTVSESLIEFALSRWDSTMYGESGVNVMFQEARDAIHDSLTSGLGSKFVVSRLSDVSVNQATDKDDKFVWRVNAQKAFVNQKDPCYIITDGCKQVFAVTYVGQSAEKQYIPIICSDTSAMNADLVHRRFRFEPTKNTYNYQESDEVPQVSG